MSINVNEDVIGSGGFAGGGLGGSGGIIIIAIILVLVFMGMGARGAHAGDYGHGGGHRGGWGHEGGGCPPVCRPVEDVALANLATCNAKEHGILATQAANDKGAVIHAIDQQSCEIKIGEMEIIRNQTALAMDAERLFMGNQINNLRDSNLELKGKILQQETVNTIQAGNAMVGHRLDQIECGMVKHPPFYAAGGSPYINPFNFQPAPMPFRGEFRENGNGCCG